MLKQCLLVCICIQVKSRKGYQGCLSSLEVASEEKLLLEPGVSRIPPEYIDSIREGCIGQLNNHNTYYDYSNFVVT